MRIIRFKTNKEDIISRIPGLFAYITFDENGNTMLHKATDNPMGCYGQIVENIIIPEGINLNINGKDIIVSNISYSYKTLINLYYKYINYEVDSFETDNDVVTGFLNFKEFINRGIGKIFVNIEFSETDYFNGNPPDKVPEYIYLINVQKLYNEISNLKKISEFYKKHIENREITDNEYEINLCCKHELYRRMGGDKYWDFLRKHLDLVNKIADEYYGYVSDDKKLTINYPINLFSNVRDLGIVTPVYSEKVEEYLKNIGYPQLIEDKQNGNKYFEQIYKTNSKLKSLRRYKDYYDEFDNKVIPDRDKDWLFYYRQEQVVNMKVLTDKFGNILRDKHDNFDDIKINDEPVDDLYAYGDFIEKIILNKEDNTITFIYWTDVHLIATCVEKKIDDDGNILICYDKFKPHCINDENEDSDYWYETDDNGVINYHGIRYEDTYTFSNDSELKEISEETFAEYVTGFYDVESKENVDIENLKIFEKYEFSLYNKLKVNEKLINYKKIKIDTVETEAKIRLTQFDDKVKPIGNDVPNEITRNEFYEGVSYTPTEDFEVSIDRGVTSIFDKHIRFSEVKTLQDMEEFSNGSYFKIQ